MYANFGFYKLGHHRLRFPVLTFVVASSLSQPQASHLLDLQPVSWRFCRLAHLLARSPACCETASPFVAQTGLNLVMLCHSFSSPMFSFGLIMLLSWWRILGEPLINAESRAISGPDLPRQPRFSSMILPPPPVLCYVAVQIFFIW